MELCCRDGDGLVAHMSVILDKSTKKDDDDDDDVADAKRRTDSTVKSTLQDVVASGRVGSITVDPSYLLFESQLGESSQQSISDKNGSIYYNLILVNCNSFLLLILIYNLYLVSLFIVCNFN